MTKNKRQITWAEVNKVRDLIRRVEVLEKEIDRLRLGLSLKIPVYNGTSIKLQYDSQMEDIVIEIVDSEKQLEDYREQIAQEKEKLLQKFEELIEDTEALEIYKLRYIECKYFRDIALDTGKSEVQVYYLHRMVGEKIVSDWD